MLHQYFNFREVMRTLSLIFGRLLIRKGFKDAKNENSGSSQRWLQTFSRQGRPTCRSDQYVEDTFLSSRVREAVGYEKGFKGLSVVRALLCSMKQLEINFTTVSTLFSRPKQCNLCHTGGEWGKRLFWYLLHQQSNFQILRNIEVKSSPSTTHWMQLSGMNTSLDRFFRSLTLKIILKNTSRIIRSV